MNFERIISVAQAGPISDAPRISQVGANVLNFVLSVFLVLAIIMLVVSGIKYFLAAGDERMIRNAKKSATFSVVGIIIVLGAMIVIRTIGSIIGG